MTAIIGMMNEVVTMKVKKQIISAMLLLFLFISVASAATIQMQNVTLAVGGKGEIPVNLDAASAGLAGYKLSGVFSTSGVATVSEVKTPEWATLKSVSDLPNESLLMTGVDLTDTVKSGSGSVYLGSIVVEGKKAGTTTLSLKFEELTDDMGSAINVTVIPAMITVSGGTNGSSTTTEVAPTPGLTVAPQQSGFLSPTAQPTSNSTNVTCPVPTITPTPVPTVSADFKSDLIIGHAPVTVSFTDLSQGYPEKFVWDFGDNSSDGVSVVQNPQHTYRSPGVFNVSLSAANKVYNNTTTKNGFITVLPLSQSRIVPNTSTTVYSVPDNASVYLDNAFFGTTPCIIPNLTPRMYQMRLVKDGYYDLVAPIHTYKGVLPSFISGFEMMPHIEKLGHPAAEPPQTGGVYITTYPEQVNVSVDNVTVGKTDIMVMNLPVGIHNLTLKKEGFTDWQDTFEIKNGLSLIQTYTFFKPYFPPEKTSEYVNLTTG